MSNITHPKATRAVTLTALLAVSMIAASCASETIEAPTPEPALAPAADASESPDNTVAAPTTDSDAASAAADPDPPPAAIEDESPTEPDPDPEPPLELAPTRSDAIAAITAVFESAAGPGTPSFKECRLLSNGEAIDLTPEQQAACIDPLTAVVEACALLGCTELGLIGGPIPEPTPEPEPEPDPTTTTEPEPATTTTAEPEPDPTTTTAEPEPDPTTTTEPEPDPTTTTEPEPERLTEADLAAARGAFNIVYSSDSPFSAVAVHLEDAANLEDTHAQFAAFGANVGGVEITATTAAAAEDRSDRVLVTFEVYVAGVSIPITGRNTSSVWLVDGTWIISRGAFCNAMIQLEVICPPVGGQPEPEQVDPTAGYVPPVHPDTPPPGWERGEDIAPGVDIMETPRLTGEDRGAIVVWLASVGGIAHGYNQWLLFNMKWALDYMGADPQCIVNEYTARVETAAGTPRGQLEPAGLRDQHGWQNCATVIDPFLPGVDRPDGRTNDVGLRLSDTPGITLAERCRAVLPPDVQLDKEWRTATYRQEPFYFEPGHAGCDAWAEWAMTHHYNPDIAAPRCHSAAHLAEEWMEHHHGTPENYPRVSC